MGQPAWDDWGGFYDHVPPPPPRNQYELGFRVPLLVVSAYTGVKNLDGTYSGYVSCPTPVGSCQFIMDFGSILRFIEDNFGLDHALKELGFSRPPVPRCLCAAIPTAPRRS